MPSGMSEPDTYKRIFTGHTLIGSGQPYHSLQLRPGILYHEVIGQA